ncbi:MAG: hypothetical protein RMJ28_02825 [Nitrososphaerota archaeon]|nr:hypothetical protein [Candidatus Calditenuaceae archaeon]MDW8073154.1 hypothetical protein [Nitrososphaerota archaeon]
MNGIEKLIGRVKQPLSLLMQQSIIVLDCTSGTRPAGIAFYTLAERYKLPLIYVYKDANRIYWLKSKETLKRELEPLL